MAKHQKVVVVGAGPVGSLAALYAAQRGHDVEIYELRPGESRVAFPHRFNLVPVRAGSQLLDGGSSHGILQAPPIAASSPDKIR